MTQSGRGYDKGVPSSGFWKWGISMTLDLYSLHTTPEPGEFIIQKFDTDYHCESVYALSTTTCMCPQGHKPTCKHRKMLPLFLEHNHLGDGWFLEWQTRLWRKPVNDIVDIGPGLEQSHQISDITSDVDVTKPAKETEGTGSEFQKWCEIISKIPNRSRNTEDPVSRSSVSAEGDKPSLSALGAEADPPGLTPPPPPPESGQPTQATGVAPVSPVGTGAQIKRRRIP